MFNLIFLVEEKMKKLNIPYGYVGISSKPNKKIEVVINGKTIHFGSKESLTFIEGADKQKRNAYIARHSKIMLKDGTRAIDKLYSPAWLSYHVLWN